jgi:hypothetical protein
MVLAVAAAIANVRRARRAHAWHVLPQVEAFLHFHDDPDGIFADVKLDRVEFTRLRVTTTREQSQFLALVARSLKTPRRGV